MADGSLIDELFQVDSMSQISLYCYCSATTLYWYDLCLTFSEEVQDIWKAKFAFPTFLFYVLRYLPLLDTAFTIAEGYPQPKQSYLSCAILGRIEETLLIVLLTASAAFVALRMYALFPRRPWLSVLVLLLGLINPAIGIYSFVSLVPTAPFYPFFVCGSNIRINATTVENVIQGARAAAIFSDGLVIVLTWVVTRNAGVRRGRVIPHRQTLSEVLWKDGMIYFVMLSAPNIAGIAISYDSWYIPVTSRYTAVFTSMCISRMMLHLRRAADPYATELSAGISLSSNIGTVQFAHSADDVGSGGASIEC